MVLYKGRDLEEIERATKDGTIDDNNLGFLEQEFLTDEFARSVYADTTYKLFKPKYATYDRAGKVAFWKAVWTCVETYAITLDFNSKFSSSGSDTVVASTFDPNAHRRTISDFKARCAPLCKYVNAAEQAPPGPSALVTGQGEWLGNTPMLKTIGGMKEVKMSDTDGATWAALDDKVNGLITGSMGACITVACLFNQGGSKDFTHGSMKHMAGGFRDDFTWSTLTNHQSVSSVAELSRQNKAFAVIATSHDNLNLGDVQKTIEQLVKLGFAKENIIVDMQMSGGFAISKSGSFGTPTTS